MSYLEYKSIFDIFKAIHNGKYDPENILISVGKHISKISIAYTFFNTIDHGYSSIDPQRDILFGYDGKESVSVNLDKNNIDRDRYKLYIKDEEDDIDYSEIYDDKDEAIIYLLNIVWNRRIAVIGIINDRNDEVFTIHEVNVNSENDILFKSDRYIANIIAKRIEDNKPLNKLKKFFGF